MSDNNLDIAWKEIELVQLRGAIDTELNHVKAVLERVSNICDSDPAEDDTILVGIQKIGGDMRQKWDDMCGTFSDISKTIGDIFNSYSTTAKNCKDPADEVSREL